MARRLAFPLALVAAVFLATGCENPVDPDAASVNGVDISRDALMDDARVLAAMEGDPLGLAAEVEHAYSAEGLASLLSLKIADVFLQQAAEEFGVAPTDEDLAAAQAQLAGVEAVPEKQRGLFVRRTALLTNLDEHIGEAVWWTDEEAAQYDELAATGQFPEVSCVHHILVDTEAEAETILDELDGGSSFEDLAAERSTDTASGAVGGDLGCNPAGSFVEEFEAAVADAQAGAVIGPVATEFGFHVILVDQPLGVPTIEGAGFEAWVALLTLNTEVSVDPRFGTWDAATLTVIPPEGAQARTDGALELGL
jgi:parvulin-like peptidyl-prolyl isomerase